MHGYAEPSPARTGTKAVVKHLPIGLKFERSESRTKESPWRKNQRLSNFVDCSIGRSIGTVCIFHRSVRRRQYREQIVANVSQHLRALPAS